MNLRQIEQLRILTTNKLVSQQKEQNKRNIFQNR